MGNDVVNQVFLRPDDSYVTKLQIVIRAFLRDYISVRNALLREQASFKSQHTMAIDHQYKVVWRALVINVRKSQSHLRSSTNIKVAV